MISGIVDRTALTARQQAMVASLLKAQAEGPEATFTNVADMLEWLERVVALDEKACLPARAKPADRVGGTPP